jgi:hypothetical protein
MNLGTTLFAQLMAFVPWTSFARIVDRYSGEETWENKVTGLVSTCSDPKPIG